MTSLLIIYDFLVNQQWPLKISRDLKVGSQNEGNEVQTSLK